MPIPLIWSTLGFSLLAIVAYVFFGEFLRTWFRFRGVRLIVCPENYQPAAVKVDALRAAKWAALSGEADVRLKTCSRWPEKQGCAQECVCQIEESPERTALHAIVQLWFSGKRCHYCHQTIDEAAALLTREGDVVAWSDIVPEDVPNFLSLAQPVCRRCYIVESFRHDHPDMVIERIHQGERPATIPPTPNAIF